MLGDLPKLAWLRLAGNPIADVSPLGHLTALRPLVLDADAAPLREGERVPVRQIEATDQAASRRR